MRGEKIQSKFHLCSAFVQAREIKIALHRQVHVHNAVLFPLRELHWRVRAPLFHPYAMLYADFAAPGGCCVKIICNCAIVFITQSDYFSLICFKCIVFFSISKNSLASIHIPHGIKYPGFILQPDIQWCSLIRVIQLNGNYNCLWHIIIEDFGQLNWYFVVGSKSSNMQLYDIFQHEKKFGKQSSFLELELLNLFFALRIIFVLTKHHKIITKFGSAATIINCCCNFISCEH
jgi:hypothetical protein